MKGGCGLRSSKCKQRVATAHVLTDLKKERKTSKNVELRALERSVVDGKGKIHLTFFGCFQYCCTVICSRERKW